MGFYEGLEAENYDRQYSDRALFKRILSYLKPHRTRLITVIAMLGLISILGAAQPVVVSKFVDILKTQAREDLAYLIPVAILLIGFSVWILNWQSRQINARIIAGVAMTLATEGFKASTEHDLSFFDEFTSGRIVSRITSDTRDFSQMVVLISETGSMLLESVVLGIVLVRTEWHLSLYLLAMIPAIFLMAVSLRNLARKVTRTGMRAMATVNATIKETISGISVAKNFRQESEIYREFEQANLTSYRVNVRRGLVLSLVFPGLNLIGAVVTAILVYTGGLSVSQGLVTAGAWYLFIISLDRFMYPIMDISSFWTQIQSGLSAAERIFALIDAETVIVQSDDHPVARLQGRIDFEHVDFRYKENEPVLKDFSLTIRPGENLAIVGHTGAGKSSIARLIARFYEFQGGKILIDKEDIRTLNLGDYRCKLGIISQVPFLFSDTVANNIRYSSFDLTDAEIEATARQIGDGEWVDTLPDGLKTQVGERGGRLSMGQRQLVALMRVLIQKPSIFILDEATASVDPFTEWQIQQALNLILSRTTSILIAHRLSTVKSADRIIVLEKGKILEEGNHDFLLAKEGHYARLYNTYFRHQSLEYIEKSRAILTQN